MATRKEKKQSLDNILKKFEQVMKALYSSKFKQAQKLLTEIQSAEINRPELKEKAYCLSRLCDRKLEKSDGGVTSDSAEIIYNHGVFCHNNGNFDEALGLFKRSLDTAGEKLDYVLYAMAATQAAQNQNDDAMSSLKEAINLNKTFRIHASNDPDFTNLAEDDNFRILVEEG